MRYDFVRWRLNVWLHVSSVDGAFVEKNKQASGVHTWPLPCARTNRFDRASVAVRIWQLVSLVRDREACLCPRWCRCRCRGCVVGVPLLLYRELCQCQCRVREPSPVSCRHRHVDGRVSRHRCHTMHTLQDIEREFGAPEAHHLLRRRQLYGDGLENITPHSGTVSCSPLLS